MTRNRKDLIHICSDYYMKEDDDVFEYCKCGAKWFINRKAHITREGVTKLF
jgi:hypothetical protein